MDRVYASGAAGSAPAAPASPSTGYPTSGNPSTGTPATKPGAYWYHMIMEELLAIIVAAGLTPASGTLNQLLQALRSAGVFITQAVSDDSTKVATTAWVRAAMSNIASAAGFVTSYATNGYIKFPSWLGGFIIQWGTVPFVSSNLSTVTWPLAFPTSVLNVMALNPSVGVVITTTGSSVTQGNFAISVSGTTNGSYLCVGR